MEFEKKIKQRIGIFAIYVIIGLIMVLINLVGNVSNDSFYSVGIVLIIIGMVKIIKNFRLINNKEAMRNLEIAEKDERNIMICDRAKSWAFSIYVMASSVAVIILQCTDSQFAAQLICYSMISIVFIYWICYHIIKRKY